MTLQLPQGKVIVPAHALQRARARCGGRLKMVLDTIAQVWNKDLRGRVAIVYGQRPIPVVRFRAGVCILVTVLEHDLGY